MLLKSSASACCARPTTQATLGQERVAYQFFKAGSFTTWDAMFAEVAAFASRIGREDLISISQSEDKSTAVVTVWYWER